MMRTRSLQFLVTACLALGCAGPSFGISLIQTGRFELTESQALTSESWIAAQESSLNGLVEKDVFLLAVTNRTAGTMRQDTWLAGAFVECSSKAEEDLRIAGDEVTCQAQVSGNATVAGRKVQITEHADVQGELLVFGQDVLVNGKIHGDATIMGSKVTLGGTFSRNLRVIASDIVLMRGFTVEGDLLYSSPEEVFMGEQMTVTGRMEKVPYSTPVFAGFTFIQRLYLQGLLFMAAVFCGMPFVSFFPRFIGLSVHHARTQPWRCLITGGLVLLIGPIFAALSLGTLVGIPFGLVFGALLAVGAYLSKFVSALVLASLLLRKQGAISFAGVVGLMLTGLLCLYIVELVPVAGDAVWFASVLLGLGGITLSAMGGIKTRKTKAPLQQGV